MSGFEENEISEKSNGGTEMVKRTIASRLPKELIDNFQIICSRVRTLREDLIRVYWLHDLPSDPETNHLKTQQSRERFHKLVFCGHWQYNQYITQLGIPQDDKCIVIDTPIEPIELKLKSKDKINLIYTSTPQRGLEILVPVFVELAKKHSNIHLHVFSSFEIYGWKEADKRYEQVFNTCKEHPQITYHGFAPREEVIKAYQDAHIFAYPSIWPECNSRALIEAMSAGCLCLHPNYAGLSDTSGNLTSMYQWDQDMNKHASKFYFLLDHAISIVQQDDAQKYLRFIKAYSDNRFHVDKIVRQWQDLLENLKERYATVESRHPDEQRMFTYRTL